MQAKKVCQESRWKMAVIKSEKKERKTERGYGIIDTRDKINLIA